MTSGTVSTAALKRSYGRTRLGIERRFLERKNPEVALAELAQAVDDLVVQVAEPFQRQSDFSLIALGGYGRREMYPHSDVDLLILFREGKRDAVEGSVTQMLHQLWDLGLDLGHQVWSIDQMKGALEPIEFGLALLDARLLANGRGPGQTLLDSVLPGLLDQNRSKLVEKIISFAEERHRIFRDTIYQLEPDLKEAPGGLRDYLTGKWLLQLGGTRPFLTQSQAEIEDAASFMRRARIWLHFTSGRNQNRLRHPLQEALALTLYGSKSGVHPDVETLMKQYFLNARILGSFCDKLMETQRPVSPVPAIAVSEIASQDNAMAVLRIFLQSIHESRPLSDATRSAIVRTLPGFGASVGCSPLRNLLRSLFQPRPGLYRTLSEMYALGVLESLFPEFGAVKARVIRDDYHQFTVDEHSLLAIKHIERLLGDENGVDPRFAGLLKETPESELLTLALLLHDVGKSDEEGHAIRSAEMAVTALERLQFSSEKIDTIVFLIRNHLAMSAVMFRRDLDDPSVINTFSDLAQGPTRLRLLTLLTYADIKAVAPGTLNQWKRDLLWQLYVESYRKLTYGFGEERVKEEDVEERLLADLPDDLETEGFELFLEGFPLSYVKTTSATEVYQHYRLARRRTQDDPVQLDLTHDGTYYRLCVVAPDRSYLFAKIAGVLSYFDMNIFRGYGFANQQGTALDLFRFSDTRKVFSLNPTEKERFLQLLHEVLKGEVPVESLLRGKETSLVHRRHFGSIQEPGLHFDNDASEGYTIAEILAPDSIGLLYRISQEIAAVECNIELLLINTEGSRAVDVFYLTHKGRKLSPELQEQLKERIIGSISIP